MSKTIDERVVEMRFDNRQFESNVKTSMSTLERLKQALKLPSGSKSLETVAAAAKKVDFSGMSKGIETVNAQFSALQVVGMTALSNITTAAMQAGKNLVNSFTLKPITDGFREYELQMNSVQTILANTASKGTTMEDVTAALDELNEYADMTIYNFGEMTRNIGTFTAAGVDLDKAVAAIKGIANLGAMSGSTSTQVSTAMYQLSQALAAGRVSLMDWNSVVNAGMGGEQFQNALKRTAEHFGYDVDGMIKKYGSFRESLTQGGWLTAEVLTETLNQISGAYTEADLIAQGYTEDQAKAIVEMANTATDAATKVKTFTQLMDTLSEAAGSGWAKSFQLILGDFEEAKEFFTGLSDYLSEIINNSSDARNALLEGAFDSNWSKMTKQIEEAGVPLDKFTEKLKEVAKEHGVAIDDMINQGQSWEQIASSGAITGDMVVETLKRMAGATDAAGKSTEDMNAKLEKFQKVVDQVWHGDYKNGEERIKALTEAGYDYAEVQALVNKTVDGHRLTLDDLSDAQLKSIGYTDEEITKLHELAVQAETSGTTLNELVYNLNKPSGRVLFLETIMNLLKAIIEPLRAVGRAFSEVFGMDSDQLYGIIEAVHAFSEALVADEQTLTNLTNTFKGLFGIISIFTTFAGGTFGIAFKALTAILDNFNLHILDVTGFIGNLLYQFSEFITSGEVFGRVFEGIVNIVKGAGGPISDFIDWLMQIPTIKNAISELSPYFEKFVGYFKNLASLDPSAAFGKFFDDIKTKLSGLTWEGFLEGLRSIGSRIREFFSGLAADMQEIGPDLIAGLQNGLSGGIEGIISKMREIGTKIVEAIKAVLGIHSPSTVMYEIGKNIIQGLLNGLKAVLSGLWDFIRGIGEGIAETFGTSLEGIGEFFSGIAKSIGEFIGNIDPATIAVVLSALGGFLILNKIASAFESFGNAAENLTSPLEGLGETFTHFNKVLDAKALQLKADAVKSFAIAIAIVAASIAVLTQLDPLMIWNAVAALGVMAGVMVGLTIAMSKFSKASSGGGFKDTIKGMLDAGKLAAMFISLGGALLMLAGAMKIIGGMDSGEVTQAGVVIGVFAVVVAALIGVTRFAGPEMDKSAKFISKIGTAFLLLGVTARLLGGMSDDGFVKAGLLIAEFTIAAGLLIGLSGLANGLGGAERSITSIGLCFVALAVAAKILGGMSEDEMLKGALMVGAFTYVVGALMLLTTVANKQVDQVGDFLAKVGGAFILMAVAAKLVGGMSAGELQTAAAALVAFSVIVGLLVGITHLASDKELVRLGTTLLAMSTSIAILAGVAVLLGMVDIGNLAKGIIAVGYLGAIVSLMTIATRGASDVKGTMIGIAAAIGVMAAALVILSFVDPGSLAVATGALSAVMGMFALIVKMAGNVQGSMGTILVMTVAVGLLSAALYLIADLPADQSLAAAGSISATLLAMSASMKILSGMKSVSVKAMGTLSIMVVVIGLIGTVLNNLSSKDPAGSIANAIAISSVLLAMSASLRLLDGINSISVTAIGGLTALVLIVGMISVIINGMSTANPVGALANAVALSTVLLAMSTACVLLSSIQTIAPMALVGMAVLTAVVTGIAFALSLMSTTNPAASLANAIGLSLVLEAMVAACILLQAVQVISGAAIAAMAVITLIVLGVAAILGYMASFDVQNALPNALALSTLIGALVAATVVLSVIGPLAAGAAAGIAGLAIVIGGISAIVLAAGAIKQIPGVDWLISEGAAFMAQLGSAIGGFVGSIIGAGLDAATSTLPQVGENLSGFMQSLEPFFAALDQVDESKVNAVASLGGMILALTGSNILDGIAQWITGESSLTKFAEQLPAFGEAMVAYSDSLEGLNAESVSASAEAGKALSELASSLPKEGGLVQAIFGEATDLDDFGDMMVEFGDALVSYSNSVSGVSNWDAISQSAQAGQALSDLAATIPKDTEGSLAGAIFGENTSLDDFGSQLVLFGDALVAYANSVAGLNVEAIASSVPAAESLVDLANAMPEGIGQVQEWLGSENEGLDTFGDKLTDFGGALSGYADVVAGKDWDSVSFATTQMERIIDQVAYVGNKASSFQTANVDGFSDQLEDFSTAITTYADNVAGKDWNTVNNATGAIKTIAEVISNLEGINTEGVPAFKQAISDLAETNVQGVVDAFAESAESLANIGGDLMDAMIEGLESGAEGVRSALSSIMDSISSFLSGQSSSSFFEAGKSFMSGIALGVIVGSSNVNAAFVLVLASATNTVRGYHSQFYSAGAYAAAGLANGIRSGIYGAVNAAVALATSAIRAAKSALNSHSPSREFIKIGKYIPQGMAIGINSFKSAVEIASTSMANSAISGANTALNALSALSDIDVDSNPTITPVLDLSNVENGVGAIDSMLGATVPLNLLGQVDSVNAMMNQRIQNGTFNDVVSGLDKVRKSIDKLERPSYTVNGITYDDGSNITGAVETLVRAARLERRI